MFFDYFLVCVCVVEFDDINSEVVQMLCILISDFMDGVNNGRIIWIFNKLRFMSIWIQ